VKVYLVFYMPRGEPVTSDTFPIRVYAFLDADAAIEAQAALRQQGQVPTLAVVEAQGRTAERDTELQRIGAEVVP
jgi:hypothetical protein